MRAKSCLWFHGFPMIASWRLRLPGRTRRPVRRKLLVPCATGRAPGCITTAMQHLPPLRLCPLRFVRLMLAQQSEAALEAVRWPRLCPSAACAWPSTRRAMPASTGSSSSWARANACDGAGLLPAAARRAPDATRPAAGKSQATASASRRPGRACSASAKSGSAASSISPAQMQVGQAGCGPDQIVGQGRTCERAARQRSRCAWAPSYSPFFMARMPDDSSNVAFCAWLPNCSATSSPRWYAASAASHCPAVSFSTPMLCQAFAIVQRSCRPSPSVSASL